MATTPNDLPTPVTREEMYLNAIAQNGTGGGGGSSTLAGLTDVDISNPSNGQTLVYNSTSGKWENGAGGGGGGSSEVLVVNEVFDETLDAYQLDSTWQEIYDAATSGKVVFVTDAGVGYVAYRFVAGVVTPNISGTGYYEVITLTANMQDYQRLNFRCSNATDYPTDV